MKNNMFNRSPEDIKMIFEVMMSTFDTSDVSHQLLTNHPTLHLPQTKSVQNLERLGLVDYEAMFREQERRDRARARERSLGRGSSTIRDLDRFLTKTCQQASDTRRQVIEGTHIQKTPPPLLMGTVSRPHIQMMKIGREGGRTKERRKTIIGAAGGVNKT